jgi:nitrogen-specific signal transduction histidine kinase
MTAGTGLGLYVARKIAIAHGGNLELDSEPSGDSNVAFHMTLPVPEREQPESELHENGLPESKPRESKMDELRENL